MLLRRSLFSAAIAAAFAAHPALAQTEAETAAPAADASEAPVAEEVVEFETITVTARKREEKIKDIPVSVSAVSGEALERQNIVQAKDIAGIVPGVNINSDSVSRSFISMRGIGATLIDTVQPGVGVFIDGVYVPNTSYLNSPLVDVARIEVLRGPQGTLFGQNTLGGAINVITKQPTDEFQAKVQGVAAGPDDYYTGAVSLSGPILGEKLLGRIGYAYHTQDGFSQNDLAGEDEGEDANPLRQRTVNGGLIFQATPGARIFLNGYHDQVDGGVTPYAPVDDTRDYEEDVQLNQTKIGRYTYSGVNLRGNFALGDMHTLTPMIAYDRRKHTVRGDGDFGPEDTLRSSEDGSIKTKTAEVKLDTKYNASWSTLFGVFAHRYVNQVDGTTVVVPFGVTMSGENEITTEAQGVYGTVFWNIDETLEASAGIRYDHQDVEAEVNGADGGEVKADEWQPRVTIRKHWTDSFMTYGSIARGFRGGGLNPGTPVPKYKGDSVWTYEIGAKTTFLDDRVALETAAFYNDYKHFIGQNSLAERDIGGIAAVNLNTGDVESYGLEAELRARLTRDWTANAGLTLVHARITDDSDYREATGRRVPTDRIIFTPDWNFNIGTDYTIPVGNDTVTLHAGVVAKGDRKGSVVNPEEDSGEPPADVPSLDKYFLVDSAVTWKHGAFTVSLFGTNLTNEKYFESYIDASLIEETELPFLVARNLGLRGDQRRVGLRVGYDF